MASIESHATFWPARIRIGQLRAMFPGIGLLLQLEALLILMMSVQTDIIGYMGMNAGQVITRFATRYVGNAIALLLPLPLATFACRFAPPAGARRIAALLLIALCYGGAAVLIAPHSSEVWTFILIGLLVTAILEFQRRALLQAESLQQTRLEAVSLDAEVARARLQLLRAQIEPHFLFNTLANVRQLARSDRESAVAMLDDLLHYFSAALPRLRTDCTALADEVQLIGAYLGIHRIRMGRRLRYEISIPRELEATQIPPMMLLTLIENAIKHGLNPLPEGGTIQLSAREERGSLKIAVSDDGRGMSSGGGSGTGLANVRSRLLLLFGAAASLEIAQRQPRGVVATLSLPLSLQAGS